MLSHIFLGMSLLGAEWVLYILVALSIFSITLIFDRILFYRTAQAGLSEFRNSLRSSVTAGKLDEARASAEKRLKSSPPTDLETEMALELLKQNRDSTPDVLTEIARDAVYRSKIGWEKNLSALATIGSNAPFLGLFGTVLGIIRAFHDLKQESGAGIQAVSSGISEALVATAVGILVAIPAVVAYNLFQRRVKSAMTEAEALKSFLIGKLAD